jgi:hypothetical protein
MLDDGMELGMSDGVLINRKGLYRYNDSLIPNGRFVITMLLGCCMLSDDQFTHSLPIGYAMCFSCICCCIAVSRQL